MTGTPLATSPRRMVFAKSYGTPSMLLPRTQLPGLVMGAALGGTSSHDFLSAWYTCSAIAKSKSSRWLTGSGDRDTGGHDPDRPSNFRIQRSALRAAADPAR